MAHLWLRAEHKKSELRTPLIPAHAKLLINRGHKITVEQTNQRIFPIQAYHNVGCEIVPAGCWQQAPKETYILGLKNLPESNTPLTHKHIYFAHAFKGQADAKTILKRFAKGGGTLFDLEYLVNDNGKRVTTFGFYAGIAGAASAILLWCHKQLNKKVPFKISYPCSSYNNLLTELKGLLQFIGKIPSTLVIGAQGRCGKGSTQFLKDIGIEPTLWDRKDTKRTTIAQEILSFDVMLNCIFVDNTTTPFLTKNDFKFNKSLSVIGDISCEPGHLNNPLPFYTQTTTFDNAAIRICEETAIDLISIDNLPTLLPLESSIHFSEQLVSHLQNLLEKNIKQQVWNRALNEYKKVRNFYFTDLTLKEVV